MGFRWSLDSGRLCNGQVSPDPSWMDFEGKQPPKLSWIPEGWTIAGTNNWLFPGPRVYLDLLEGFF